MITKVYLLNVPLENDYVHTLYFNDPETQQAYFQSRLVGNPYDNFSYQRKDNLIRIPKVFDKLIGCNYVMYQNKAQSDKWYYAFITDMKYVNDEMTEVSIETDVIQTWMFDYTVKPSFVEREHVVDDVMGENTLPEQVELGEYFCNKHTKAGYSDKTTMSIVVGATKTPEGENVRGLLYNNVYSGVKYYAFDNSIEGIAKLNEWLALFPEDGAAESITCMFMAPNKAFARQIAEGGADTVAQSNTVSSWYINSSDAGAINTNIAITTNLFNGYQPRNKKLLCYPYRCLLASNNSGAAAQYKYEQFYEMHDTTKVFIPPKFKIESCATPGGSIRLIPLEYNGVERNDEEGLNLGKFPVLNWTSDLFTNWMTQNGVNLAVSLGASALQIAGGIGLAATGGGALIGGGMVTSGITGVAGALGEVYSHSLQPPQAEGNLNCGDVVTASGTNDFHFYDMTIKEEYARIIDDYFDMFGYKINRVKEPEYAHRENYWYTKTIDVNIDGAIPTKDLQKIKDCYNKGITFWWKPENIGNYSVSNAHS